MQEVFERARLKVGHHEDENVDEDENGDEGENGDEDENGDDNDDLELKRR